MVRLTEAARDKEVKDSKLFVGKVLIDIIWFQFPQLTATWHQKEKTLTGKLVKFPQSPQLNFDVYGIEIETQGIKRTFTLVNFDDINEFERIREKLASIWDNHLETAVSGRNMQINPEVTVKVKGRLNIVSPEQANPQILLDSVEDITTI